MESKNDQVLEKVLNKKPARMMRVFKSSAGTLFYVLTNGKACHFVKGKYLTDMPNEIAELQEQVDKKHPHIYVDEKEKEVDVNADPLKNVKEAAIKEYLEEQKKAQEAALDPSKNMGGTENKPAITPANSGGVGNAAGASNSVGARLVNLKK